MQIKHTQNEYISSLIYLKKIYLLRLMKKIFLILMLVPILSNCTQYSAVINPSLTLASGGTLTQASSSLASSIAVGQVRQSVEAEMTTQNYCSTFHSSELNEIFFETVDHLDCIYDPMSIYR
tara:strand:- start:12 stop:377 length:366 start_codon:yes stop_codon:yes gene_type:complete